MAEKAEQCIWKDLLSTGNKLYRKYYYALKGTKAVECDNCPGHSYKCGSYLSNEELERRDKERNLEQIMSSK